MTLILLGMKTPKIQLIIYKYKILNINSLKNVKRKKLL